MVASGPIQLSYPPGSNL